MLKQALPGLICSQDHNQGFGLPVGPFDAICLVQEFNVVAHAFLLNVSNASRYVDLKADTLALLSCYR